MLDQVPVIDQTVNAVVEPYKKPEGKFLVPEVFDTEKEARKFVKANGSGYVSQRLDGRWVTLFVKER